MRLVVILLLALTVALPARALTATVAVDPAFAHVAARLAEVFAQTTGLKVLLSVDSEPQTDRADILLAADSELPARLAETGAAAADTLFTYATERDAILLQAGASNPVARAFLEFLLSPEAWDVIVSHGFGAH